MRREVILKSVRRIQTDLVNSGVSEMLSTAFEKIRRASTEEGRKQHWVSWAAFQEFSIRYSSYTEEEKRVLSILGLERLSSADYWQKLSLSPNPAEMYELNNSISSAVEILPKIVELFKQSHVEEFESQDSDPPDELRGKTLIRLILVEDEQQYSSPERLIVALSAFSGLYAVIARLSSEPSNDLIVLAIDSGSDKSFDFLGAGKIMEQLRLLIASLWDRRVLYRAAPLAQSLNLISQSLPILKEIEALREEGALSPEEAELLRRKTIECSTKFLESGAITQDMDFRSELSPRALMRPEQKLLAAPIPDQANPKTPDAEKVDADGGMGAPSEPSAPDEGEDAVDRLTREELTQLKDLLRTSVSPNAATRPSRRAKKNS